MNIYQIQVDDEADYLAAYHPDTYGTEIIFPSGNKYIYAYTALTTLVKGGCCAINQDTGDAAGQNPRATVPATSSIYHLFGISAETVTAAGGIWVQTKGRCTYARVDGATDVAINDPLKPVNAKQYLAQDHADTPTASFMAVAEEAEADAIAAQTDITNGDADKTIYLPERWATVA